MASDTGGFVPGTAAVLDSSITEQTVDSRLILPYVSPQGLIGISSVFTHVLDPLKPLSKTDNEIHFALPDTLNSYIDLRNIKMYIRGSLVRQKGEKLAAQEKVSIADNFCHSLFECVTILLGKNQLEIQHNLYPFKAYLKQLERYSQKCIEMSMAGLTIDAPVPGIKDMTTAVARTAYIAESQEIEFTDNILADFLNSNGFLKPGFPFKIRFRKSTPAFYTVKHPDNTNSYVFNLEEFTLKVPCVVVQPDIAELLSRQLDVAPADYRFTGTNIIQYTISGDTLTAKFSRVFQGKLPSKLLVAFYDQESFIGSETSLPLVTSNVNVQNISLSINSVVVRQFNVNFKEKLYLELYDKFIEYVGASGSDYYIPYNQYIRGHMFYPFILNQKPEGMPVLPIQALNQGFIDLTITLRERPGNDVIMAVFYQSPECLSITNKDMARFDPVIK